jgi:hypothetical protein
VLENSTRNASTMSVKMLTKGMKKGSAAGSVIRTQVRSAQSNTFHSVSEHFTNLLQG